jgi:hypothetical protein
MKSAIGSIMIMILVHIHIECHSTVEQLLRLGVALPGGGGWAMVKVPPM